MCEFCDEVDDKKFLVKTGQPIVEPLVYETEPQSGLTDAPMDFDYKYLRPGAIRIPDRQVRGKMDDIQPIVPPPPPTKNCQCVYCQKMRDSEFYKRAEQRGVSNAIESIMSHNPFLDLIRERKEKEGLREIGFNDKLEDGNKFGFRPLPTEDDKQIGYEPSEMKWKEDEKIKDILSQLFESTKPHPIAVEEIPDEYLGESIIKSPIFDYGEIFKPWTEVLAKAQDYGFSLTIDKTKFKLEFDKASETEKEVTIKLVRK